LIPYIQWNKHVVLFVHPAARQLCGFIYPATPSQLDVCCFGRADGSLLYERKAFLVISITGALYRRAAHSPYNGV
jgi:hypothetical protein